MRITKHNSSMTENKTADSVVKTAGRVFEILEYFREVRTPLSIREIAERFGYPVSSTSVLMKSLATLGYMTYDRELRAFFPSLRVATLGDWLFDAMYSGGDLLRLLENVCRDTGETAMLAVQNDIYAQYLHIMPNREQIIQLNIPVGTRRLLCWSGMGWAILSQLGDEQIERMVERTLNRLQSDPVREKISLKSVMAKVRLVRETGYALSDRTVTVGAGVIAMPLPVATNGMRLAIAAGGVADRLISNKDEIVKAMAKHVKIYSKSLKSDT